MADQPFKVRQSVTIHRAGDTRDGQTGIVMYLTRYQKATGTPQAACVAFESNGHCRGDVYGNDEMERTE